MKITAKIVTFFLLFALVLPALADEDDDKAAKAYVGKLDAVQIKLKAVVSELAEAQRTLKKINSGLEQTYMTSTRTLYQDDFEAASAIMAPIGPKVSKLEKEVELLLQAPVAHKDTHRKAKELARQVETLERKFKHGQSLEELGKEIDQWFSKTVNEMRLPRADDYKGIEREAVANMVKTTKNFGKVLKDLKKVSADILAATKP